MQFWMWGLGPAKTTTINERYACRDTSPEVSAILGSAVGHPGRGVPTEFSFGSFITMAPLLYTHSHASMLCVEA